ncbi:hypothetical protein AAE478_000241 [Parahypoxylon ruwenzoriense]
MSESLSGGAIIFIILSAIYGFCTAAIAARQTQDALKSREFPRNCIVLPPMAISIWLYRWVIVTLILLPTFIWWALQTGPECLCIKKGRHTRRNTRRNKKHEAEPSRYKARTHGRRNGNPKKNNRGKGDGVKKARHAPVHHHPPRNQTYGDVESLRTPPPVYMSRDPAFAV